MTIKRFLMSIHLSTYLNRNIFHKKRSYLNFLNCKSYVSPFFSTFLVDFFPSNNNVQNSSKNWVKKRPNLDCSKQFCPNIFNFLHRNFLHLMSFCIKLFIRFRYRQKLLARWQPYLISYLKCFWADWWTDW